MSEDQSAFATKVRENRFKFISKKDDESSEEIEKKIKESFNNYDTNNSDSLNKTEFLAAAMEMGIAFKTDDEKDALFAKVGEGKEEMNFEQFKTWMTSRLVINLSDPESVKGAFKTLADDKGGITENQMTQAGLSPEDIEFVKTNMAQNEDGSYDYAGFVSEQMGA